MDEEKIEKIIDSIVIFCENWLVLFVGLFLLAYLLYEKMYLVGVAILIVSFILNHFIKKYFRKKNEDIELSKLTA